MAELDEIAPNYRRAQVRWADAPTLNKHYTALASCFAGSGYGLVEHVKSFVESVCVTIMSELREPMPPSSTPTTTELLVAALKPLGLSNTKGASKLDKVLSGFNKIADGLNEMRNETGSVAHGKDAFLDAVTADHARAFLMVGDAILGVLLSALEGREPDLSVTREPYENFPHLNERIDRAVNVEVRIDEDGDRSVVVFSVVTGPREAIELRVEPSRLLYGIDRDAYIEVLKTADLVIAEVNEISAGLESEAGPSRPAMVLEPSPKTDPRVGLASAYLGPFEKFQSGISGFLDAEGVEGATADEAGNTLLDSVLTTIELNMGVDWTDRETIRARLKVAFKRVLVRFGLGAEESEKVAGRLVAWLRVQIGSVEVSSLASIAEVQGSSSGVN